MLAFGLLRDRPTPSLSPVIMEWALGRTGLSGQYRLFQVAPDQLARFIHRTDWDGLNVTIPHKTAAFDLCDETTLRAQRARAVNTLFHRAGRIWGDNTDVGGFRYALMRVLPPDLALQRVLVIGTGGAARAVLVALSESVLAPEVSVATRDVEGARARLEHLTPLFPALHYLTLAQAARRLSEFNLVVQASPVGGLREPGLPLPGPLRFQRRSLVMDLIYQPPITFFLRDADLSGARIENGLVMLIAQAAESFEIWTGTPFPLDAAMRELLPQLRR